jgi:hypothetical protein
MTIFPSTKVPQTVMPLKIIVRLTPIFQIATIPTQVTTQILLTDPSSPIGTADTGARDGGPMDPRATGGEIEAIIPSVPVTAIMVDVIIIGAEAVISDASKRDPPEEAATAIFG